MIRHLYFLFFLFLLTVYAGVLPAQPVIPFDSPRWTIKGDSVKQESFLGRKCLKLYNGTALLSDADFKNGILSFDIALTKGRYFPGIGFRMQDKENGEVYYLRPHQSGNPDAVQYYPEYNGGGGWQLYYGEGFGNAHLLPTDRWIHIKILVRDSSAEVYFDREKTPALSIHKLLRPVKAGMISLENTFPATVRFANFSYEATDAVVLAGKPVADPVLPPGTFTEWQVSAPFDESMVVDQPLLSTIDTKKLSWTSLKTDARGIADLSILAGAVPGKNTVFVKQTIWSDKDQLRKLNFGFSDRARVYCNGRLLFQGADGFMSRDYRFLGTMGYYDAVWLELKKGRNELWVAVSEDIGGWGIEARMEGEGAGSPVAVSYGDNPLAGHYMTMPDGDRIYYEIYGSGRPVVLLHGGLYGDISEYEQLIPKLAGQYQVIAIETRGHAKSGVGRIPYTYSLFSSDAYAIIREVTRDSILLVGFSDGAVSAMDLTIRHPELVRKLVFAGGNISKESYKPGELENLKALTGDTIEKYDPVFVKDRKRLMPEPGRWNEFVDKLKDAWMNQVPVTKAQMAKVKCPVLVVGGDRDQYNGVENFLEVYRSLPNAKLAIIPGSDHIVFYRRPELMENMVSSFLQ